MAKGEKKAATSRRAKESGNGQARQAESGGGSSESRIRERAYELYLQRGDGPGDDVRDWLAAEREFQQPGDDEDRAG